MAQYPVADVDYDELSERIFADFSVEVFTSIPENDEDLHDDWFTEWLDNDDDDDF